MASRPGEALPIRATRSGVKLGESNQREISSYIGKEAGRRTVAGDAVPGKDVVSPLARETAAAALEAGGSGG